MTRKRYKKLLMSVGYSRNSAERMCDRVVRRKRAYAEEWELIMPSAVMTKGVKTAILAKGFSEFANSVQNASIAAKNASIAIQRLSRAAKGILE